MPRVPRAYRVAEKIREILAVDIIHCGDTRLALVSLTAVTISPDLREANVFWTVHGGKERLPEVKEGLDHHQKRMKSKVGKLLGIRFTPNLRFFYDDTLDIVDEVDSLMKKVAEREKNGGQ